MNYGIIQPPGDIAEYVRFFWFSEFSASEQTPFVHHAFAYPCPELMFCYRGQFSYTSTFESERILSSGVYGQTSSFNHTVSKTDFGIFGVYLYPHSLPQLFDLPAYAVTNQFADMRSLFGKDGEMLEEKIMLASNADQRVKIVSDFLRSRLANARTEYKNLASTIKQITGSYQSLSVKMLASDNYVSVRQFERKFKELSGFSPKLFLRIARFNSMLNKSYRGVSLTRAVYEQGYHDKSHFIHDFRKFSGCSPKDYFREDVMSASDRGTIIFDL